MLHSSVLQFERAEANKALRFRRGEMVVCTFTMQVRPYYLILTPL